MTWAVVRSVVVHYLRVCTRDATVQVSTVCPYASGIVLILKKCFSGSLFVSSLFKHTLRFVMLQNFLLDSMGEKRLLDHEWFLLNVWSILLSLSAAAFCLRCPFLHSYVIASWSVYCGNCVDHLLCKTELVLVTLHLLPGWCSSSTSSTITTITINLYDISRAAMQKFGPSRLHLAYPVVDHISIVRPTLKHKISRFDYVRLNLPLST